MACTSAATPAELIAVGERVELDGDALARTSRLVAKFDSAAVKDGVPVLRAQKMSVKIFYGDECLAALDKILHYFDLTA